MSKYEIIKTNKYIDAKPKSMIIEKRAMSNPVENKFFQKIISPSNAYNTTSKNLQIKKSGGLIEFIQNAFKSLGGTRGESTALLIETLTSIIPDAKFIYDRPELMKLINESYILPTYLVESINKRIADGIPAKTIDSIVLPIFSPAASTIPSLKNKVIDAFPSNKDDLIDAILFPQNNRKTLGIKYPRYGVTPKKTKEEVFALPKEFKGIFNSMGRKVSETGDGLIEIAAKLSNTDKNKMASHMINEATANYTPEEFDELNNLLSPNWHEARGINSHIPESESAMMSSISPKEYGIASLDGKTPKRPAWDSSRKTIETRFEDDKPESWSNYDDYISGSSVYPSERVRKMNKIKNKRKSS